MQPDVEPLLQQGVLGVLCAILLVWIWHKDKQHVVDVKSLRKELSVEQKARVEDAQEFTTMALSIQEKVTTSVTEIRGIMKEYAELGKTVGELVAVLKRGRNGHG